ncbi:PTS transporter subunit EIIC [Vallitalea sp.]|jgi:PTS system N-acetylglucosamine-specific IIC component|uniref:PTS transporter subunit EIIC n=1 Tax=Vallitalea sp. TaxID=1882829 RepID=UPI0025F539A0|nr:PTS transporter subunit EIIC [Vallitalea sp.]MCT4687981.1 PTS transporter subunit EIIC [Vallitalea sp.]
MQVFSKLQKLGTALMLPIAVLPAAGILLRIGQPDVLNIPFISNAGDAVFSNLALLFAIGVAIGLSKDKSSIAAFSGSIAYFMVIAGINAIVPGTDIGVLGGIVTGGVTAFIYNKLKDNKFGKSVVPFVTSIASIPLSLLFCVVWPFIAKGLDMFGNFVIQSGAVGAGVYGFLNRLLIPTGLHHILNNIFWMNFGEFTNAAGEIVRGDYARYLAGDPSAGIYMAGFYPIMMFALPAAGLAMYTCAKKANKALVGSMIFSLAFTSFLTGVTEPLEFSFIFLAPVLYVIHAVLAGLSLIVCNILGILHGFIFSAGFIDYALYFKLATKPLLLLPIGLCFGVVYYFVFVFAIKKLNLPTPGRLDEQGGNIDALIADLGMAGIAAEFVMALGGKQNIKAVDACITRLRLTLNDSSIVDDDELKKLGASGVLRPNNKNMQVIVGPKAELVVDEMKKIV